ncbi:MAG: SDR family NAD(P)-dependent oxidoreductase [Myxococcota bacterium]
MTERKGLALITGASYGIGAELARSFAKRGHPLIIVARSHERLELLAQSISINCDQQVYIEVCDLCDPQARADMFVRLGKQNLKPVYLVNNAGIGSNGPFHTLDSHRECDQVRLNIEALVDLSRHFLPDMVANDTGGILNIASTAGFQPGPYMATYFATKAFVISFTEALAYEQRRSNVHLTAFCPGATESEFAHAAGNDTSRLFQQNVATAEAVAEAAYGAFLNQKTVAVHGWLNGLSAFGSSLSPRWLTNRIAAWLNQSSNG